MSENIIQGNEILRLEFGRDAINSTDNPLHFIASEVVATIERGVPHDIALFMASAKKVVVKIEIE